MANIDLSLAVICAEIKKRKTLIFEPPSRYTPNNPYIDNPQYNQNDFNMRRKAEILLYRKNSSQSNSTLTKAQQYAKLINSNASMSKYNDTILYQNDGSGNFYQIVVKYPDRYTVSQVVVGYDIYDNSINIDVYNIIPGKRAVPCPTKINVPTSSSNVPGPPMNLYNDTNVPLVYYNNTFQSYGIINSVNNEPWTVVPKKNLKFYASLNNLLANLVINNSIKNFATTFSIKVPVSIYFTATTRSDIPDGPIVLKNNTINIETTNVFTFYNGKQITYSRQPIVTFDNNETIQFDISFNKSFVSNITYNSKGQAINNSYYNNTFTGRYFLGNLNISNLYLLTAPSYIYDINLNFFMASSILSNANYLSYFDTFAMGVYSNVDSTFYPNIATNIVLKNNSRYPLSTFQFSGY